MSDGGKGSKPRPYGVPKEVFDDNFKTIFGESRLERMKREQAEREQKSERNDQ